MSKRVKSIIISAIALLVLGAVTLAVTLIDFDGGDDGPVSSLTEQQQIETGGQIELFAYNTDQFLKAEIKNNYNDYVIKRKGEEDWVIEGMEDFLLGSDATDKLVITSTQLVATNIVSENPTEFEPYGLDEPLAKVILHYSTGEKLELWIGDTNATGSEYIYFKNNNKIYTTTSGWSAPYTCKNTYYLDMTVVDDIETDKDGNEIDPHVKKITYSGRGVENTIILEENPEYLAELERLEKVESDETADATIMPAQFLFKAPFKADASNDTFAGRQYDYFGLNAKDIYAAVATGQDLKACGLDNPYVTIEVVTANSTITLKLGNKTKFEDTECYYVISNQRNTIFVVDASNFTFFEEDLVKYMSSIVVNVMIDDIKDLTIEHGSEKYVFETSGKGDDLVVRYQGKKASTSEYRDLYQLVMLVYCEESVKPNEYSGKGDFKLTYTYRDKEKVDVVEYVKVATRKYMIRLNGSDLGLVRSKYVDTLAFGVKEFIAGRDVPSSY